MPPESKTAQVPVRRPGAIVIGHDSLGDIGGEPLVQPGLLELVGGHQPVPVLVAELMNRHALRTLEGRRSMPVAADSDQGGVFHATGTAGAVLRIDNGQRVVGVGAVPAPQVPYGGKGRGKDAILLIGVLGLEEESHFHRWKIRDAVPGTDEGALQFERVRIGRPGEVMHGVLQKAPGYRSILVMLFLAHLPAGGPHHIGRRCGDGHVIVAEVSEEFAVGMELVMVPSITTLKDRQFGEPLGRHEEVAFESCARKGVRQTGGEVHVDGDGGSRRHRGFQGKQGDGAILLVPVIRLSKNHAVPVFIPAVDGNAMDLHPAPLALLHRP